jgi:hypothetical protein
MSRTTGFRLLFSCLLFATTAAQAADPVKGHRAGRAGTANDLRAGLTAAPAIQTITGNPLTIVIGSDTSFQVVNSAVPGGSGQIYPGSCTTTPTDAGIFAWVGGTYFSPNLDEHFCGSAGQPGTPWTEVSMSPVAGSGSAGDPFRVTVVTIAGTTGVTLTTEYSYVNGESFFRMTKTFCSASATTLKAFIGADIYLAGSDSGIPYLEPTSNSPGGTDCSGGGYTILMVPITPADGYSARGYSTVWSEIAAGNLSNIVNTSGCQDNGSALQWNRNLTGGGCVTITSAVSFGAIPTIAQFRVDSVAPAQGAPGDTLTVVISGIGFQGGTTFNFGPGTTVTSTTINSSNQATVILSISPAAASGFRDVTGTQSPGGLTHTATNAFEVTGTGSGCPSVPILAAPEENASSVPTSGTMAWDGSAEYFDVYFGPVGQGCSMSQASTPNNFLQYVGLQQGTEYEWRVVANRTGCQPETSVCQRFRTVTTCSTAPPTLLSPGSGAIVTSPGTFSWTAVPGATNYRVFVVVGGSTEVALGQTTGTSLVATLPENVTGWFVIAEGVPGCGNLRSATTNFLVCNPPGQPLASVIAESTSGQTYTLSWEPVSNATRYEVLEGNDPGFHDAQVFSTTDEFMRFTKSGVTRATPFYYQVRAFNSCFQGSGPSSPTVRVVVMPVPGRDEPSIYVNAPVGSKIPITIPIFVPGEPGRSLPFTAMVDKPWMSVQPDSGTLPESGVVLNVTLDPTDLPNGTFTGTLIVTLSGLENGRVTTNSNHVRSTPISINLVTPVTPIGSGPPNPASLIIPAVGHLDGADARWRSDVRIANTTATPSRYLLTFTPADRTIGVKQTSVQVGPGETTALDDVIRAWYGAGSLGESSIGVLEVRPLDGGSSPDGSLATVVSSRTYAQTQGGTLGEFIPGVPFSRFIGLVGSGQPQPVLNLQQIAQNQSYRTNVGLVEASGSPVSVLLSVFNSAGSKLVDIPVDLMPNEQKQLNSLLADHNITLNDGRIEVRVTGGGGEVTAYAAVVDNRSRDQLFVPATTLGQIASSRYVVPGIADLIAGAALWRSDMRIFNSGSTPQVVTLTLHPLNNSAPPLTATVTVEPNEVEVLDNVVRALFGASNVGGAVHVTTPSVSSLVVTARTYNQTSSGTLGLFIPAVSAEDAIGLGGRTLNLVQLEDSVRNRTNVGIAEVTGNPVTVELMVHLPDTKVTPRIEIPLAANEFRQLGILRELGIGNVYNARISMRVISGAGKVTAYGSVIDMRTNDSTYIPAQ